MDKQRKTDWELVQRMLSGDQDAFESFWRLYFPGLYRFVLSRLGQNEAATEEVVQNALCQAISKLETYRGEAVLFTWLCTFCRHEMSAFMRNDKRVFGQIHLVRETPEVQASLESLLAVAEDRPDQSALRQEISHLVQTALDALPSHYASALEWKYVEGLSVKEIASRLETGPKAVESMLTRARAAFRDAFSSLQGSVNWASYFLAENS
jgi:RNA polymerase sigma-70 factor (ECF subfamily)